MVLAKLIQAAEIGPQDRVLDVGCATGYSSALLARLARQVTALEEDATLARHARENLAAVGAANAEVVSGPLTGGWPAGAPYDVILVDGAAEVVPERLLRQLAEGGRLVGVVGRAPASKAVLYLAGGRAGERGADLRCRGAGAAGVRRTPAVRILIPVMDRVSHSEVWRGKRKPRVFHAFVPAEFLQGFRKARGPLMVKAGSVRFRVSGVAGDARA